MDAHPGRELDRSRNGGWHAAIPFVAGVVSIGSGVAIACWAVVLTLLWDISIAPWITAGGGLVIVLCALLLVRFGFRLLARVR